MRIIELNLLAYGKFTDHRLAFPKAANDFHIIVGPNEAGKSTLRRAITELLFGMAHQSTLGFKHPQSDLKVSGVLEGRTGELAFVRTKQRKSLRSLTDDVLPETYLDAILGSLTQETFEQLHCLDHERLLKGGQGIVDPRNSVSQILFQAASGLEGFATIQGELGERIGALFATRGRNNEFTKAVERYTSAQKNLKEVQVRARDWVEARDALKSADEALEAERDVRRQHETQRTCWERARRLGPLVDRLAKLQQEISAVGSTLQFASDAKAVLDAGIANIDAAQAKVKTREEDVAVREQLLSKIVVDKEVLERAGDIDQLAQLCSQYANHHRDLPLRRSEVDHWLRDVLARSEQFGWGSAEEEIRRRLPDEKSLRVIGTLVKERGTLLTGAQAAKEAAEQRRIVVDDLQKKLNTSPVAEVDAQLSQFLAEALPWKSRDAQLRALRSAMESAEASVRSAFSALGHPCPTEEELRSMRVPSLERVTSLRNRRLGITQSIDVARSLVAQSKANAADLDLRIVQFERSHKVVTLVEVSEARRDRDEHWNTIKAAEVPLSTGAPQLDVLIRLADELGDARALSVADAVELQALRDQSEKANEERRRHEQALGSAAQALERFDADWDRAASSIGLQGMELDDLSDWLARRSEALRAVDSFAEKKRKYEEELDGVAQARNNLLEAMSKAGLHATSESKLAVLCMEAEQYIKNVERKHVERQGFEEQFEAESRALRAALKAEVTKAAAVENWASQWKDALSNANILGVSDDVAEVEAAVAAAALIRHLLEKVDNHRSERIGPMEADLEQLAGAARTLALAFAPEMAEGTPEELARHLCGRLEEAKRQSNRRTEAEDFLDNAIRDLEEARSALKEASRSLQPVLRAAGVDDPLLALPVVQKAQLKAEYEDEVSAIKLSLEKDSDGLTLEQVQAEVVSHPPAEAQAKLLVLKDLLGDSDRKLPVLLEAQIAAKQAFDAINGGNQAAMAEAQKQEALSDMSDAGEEYVQLAAASALLKWAVDKYRDCKQGPLLQRASLIFRSLTRGSFEKLRVDYDRSSPALLAYRPNNQFVGVDGLSDGTRDQLFLALRIAALELQSEQGAPVPFVADDLFINFDDKRSHAGLQALYELSARTQVLFLSHQEHLLPVVQQLFPDANTIILQAEDVLG